MLAEVKSVQDYFETLDKRFVASDAKGVNAVFQYNIKGEGGGRWYVTVDNGKLDILKGLHPSPTVTLEMGSDNYVNMVNGKLDGTYAYMMSKLKVTGDRKLAQKIMPKIFPVRTTVQQTIEPPKIERKNGLERSNEDRMVEYTSRMIRGILRLLTT